jgi:NAD(P)-dependent dehydrogenase (short-subunit alcohol dehydrogenase family)
MDTSIHPHVPTRCNMPDFSNCVVIITGASGNLGQAVTKAFFEAGASLALIDHKKTQMTKIFGGAQVDTDRHLSISPVDVTDPDAVRQAVEAVVRRFGRIDVLVNTVGGYRAGKPLHETPVETLDFLFNLNVRSTFLMCQAVIPAMLVQGGGKIINTGARSGQRGGKGNAAYSASKSAVIRMTESMAVELKAAGINVNCVLPGIIDTPQNRESLPKADYSRWEKPDSIADVILFLASNAARDISGAALPLDGRE